MKNINILFTISLFMIIQTSCATLNRAQGEIQIFTALDNISKGQELQDLKMGYRHWIMAQSIKMNMI